MSYTSIALNPVQPLAYVAILLLVAGCWLQWRQRQVWKLYASMILTHVGFLLTAIAIDVMPLTAGYWNVIIYNVIALVLALLGMAVVIAYIQKIASHRDLRGFAALYYRSPSLLVITTILLMSLAGLPITPLFWGRIFIMLAMIQTKSYWLFLIHLLAMLFVLPMYFAVFKQMFMRSGGAVGPTNKQRWEQEQAATHMRMDNHLLSGEDVLRLPMTIALLLWIVVIMTLGLAVYPGLLL